MEKGMFAVEINAHDGHGWIITDGPVPRRQARELKRSYEESYWRVRVVPTGKIVERDA